MLEHIMSLASAIVQPSEAEKPLLAALCTAAQARLAGRRGGGPARGEGPAAWPRPAPLRAAAGRRPGRGSGGEVQQFSAGDVSIRTGGSLGEAAAAMERQAMALLDAYSEDGGFAFLGVRG